ncbi:hypothetical protein [Limnohabitans sp. Bal53]|uniref:hypothetical protein n=1 Tax=Limnohabitans sp. Bal53 TaxID=1977910 RepID=UPI000D3BA548|nr:hypothetical protein [Limnohabitans sp. Bal53]PUE41638.1 hypothetical protein B9Z50_08105 [Limnohabitans sp. Bal53]
MATYLETIRARCDEITEAQTKTANIADAKATAEWTERLTPLEDRLAKLLANIPAEIKSQGLSLPALRTMLAGKWRGKCHPGELGIALRRLGYERRRNWSDGGQSFCALWYQSDVEK